MAKLRSVNVNFWSDGYIEDLPYKGKLLFVYLITNSRAQIGGFYEITVKKMSDETGMDRAECVEFLETFQTDKKLTYQDGWIVLHNSLKNQNLSPQMVKGVVIPLMDAPEWVRNIVWSVVNSIEAVNSDFVVALKAIREQAEKKAQKTASFNLDEEIAKISKWFDRLRTEPSPNGQRPLHNSQEPLGNGHLMVKEGEGEDKGEVEVEVEDPPLPPEGGGDSSPGKEAVLPAQGLTPPEELKTRIELIAAAIGAKDVANMPQQQKWRTFAMQTMRERFGIDRVLAAIQSERVRCRSSPQYFAPDGVLKVLQAGKPSAGGTDGKFVNRDGRKLGELSR